MIKNRYYIIQKCLERLRSQGCNFPTSQIIKDYLKRNDRYKQDNFVIHVITELNDRINAQQVLKGGE